MCHITLDSQYLLKGNINLQMITDIKKLVMYLMVFLLTSKNLVPKFPRRAWCNIIFCLLLIIMCLTKNSHFAQFLMVFYQFSITFKLTTANIDRHFHIKTAILKAGNQISVMQ